MLLRSRAFTFAAFHGRFVAIQFAIVTVLLLLSLAAYVFVAITGHERALGLVRIVDVGAEQSLPTYFSTLNLLLAALLLLLIWALGPRENGPSHRYWLALGLLFVLLSIDEAVSIHEVLGDILTHRVLRVHPIFDYHSWVPFGIAFVLVVGGLFVNFLRQLPRRLVLQFIAAGVLFVGGALGVEFVGAIMMYTGIATPHDILYKLRRLIEEGGEMYGIVLFNAALFGELASRELRLRVEAEAPQSAAIIMHSVAAVPPAAKPVHAD
jgi:hypothetical protein